MFHKNRDKGKTVVDGTVKARKLGIAAAVDKAKVMEKAMTRRMQ